MASASRLNTLRPKTIKNKWFLDTFINSFNEGENKITPKQSEVFKKYLDIKYSGIYGDEYEAYINNYKTRIYLVERYNKLIITNCDSEESYIFSDRVFYNIDKLKEYLKEYNYKSYEELKKQIKHIKYN